jgi:hypothetical protein
MPRGGAFQVIAHPHRVESHHDAMNATLRQHRFHGDLMASARQASLPGAQAHTVKGDASISVDFRNMPRGVVPNASSSGIFREVKLNRGRAGAIASQEG